MVSPITKIANTLLTPPYCQLCRLPIPNGGKLWCHHCRQRFQQTPYCQRCGSNTLTMTPHCGRCLTKPPPWQHFVRLGEYQFPLRTLVHQLKFERKFWLAQPLGHLLAAQIQTPAPVVIPVPLHPLRRLYRSFNQSTLLADAIAEKTHSNCLPQAIRRKLYTQPQHQLSRQQRQRNLHGAFILKEQSLPNHVAIVDDVVTTGSTVAAIATLLQQNGVEQIDIYCLCFTSKVESHKTPQESD
ncbi:ComF family protein [Photobacterium makurazakiensis]|uniref:ComF family protein n=1 Tax=Photobacterium makurazakiensis TaxID=2910234 RepID=UPI003D13B02E